MHFELSAVDRRIYQTQLQDFLPQRMLDCHTHIWRRSFVEATPEARGAKWPSRVADENPIEDLSETYALLFPGKQVTPLIFSSPSRQLHLDQGNGYISQVAREHGLPALLVSTPEWSGAEIEERVQAGSFLGLKPYLNFAPLEIPEPDVTIFDFLPQAQLEVADQRGWVIMLHIPRKARLRDPLNLEQLRYIDRRYPRAKVIIAHIGRAYCPEDIGNAFEVLAETEHLVFDFSANTSAVAMEGLLRAVGPGRVLFGSDLPILRMRTRRICENGFYVNLVPPALYGDVSDDPHLREVTAEEGKTLSLFMYEELLAFRQAAEAVGLSRQAIEAVFCGNAERLLSRWGA